MDPNKLESVEEPWSYVVALASFIAQGILGGFVYTTGIFYTVFKQQYPDTSEVAISWMCSLPITLWFIMGPLGSMITNRFGCRLCAIVGGLLCSSSLSACFFATEFYTVFIFYGLLAGIGNGIHYVGFITVVNHYFKKYRLTANIITPIGLTSGMALYAAFVPILNEAFSWRGTLLILGGISFNICALGCLLFPKISTLTTNTAHRKIIKLSLLKDSHFQLFAIQCLFCNLASSMIFLHLPSLIISYNLGTSTASLSLTLYGIANCFGKIFHSVVGCFRKPDSTVLYTCSLTICGSVMILIPTLNEQVWVLVLVFVLAFCYCVTGGHNVEVILYLVGSENISDGLGFGQVAKASGSLLAGPLAGLLYTGTQMYSTSFYVGGTLMIFGCVLMIPIVRKVLQNRKHNDIPMVHSVAIGNEKKDVKELHSNNGAMQPMLD